MSSFNKVMLMGRLTRDPEVRRIGKGTAVSDLGLAISEKVKGKDGALTERTIFVDVVVWDKQAEVCETYLSKGSRIFVEGRLQMDEWEDKDGNKRKKLRVRGDRVHFMDTKATRQGEAAASRASEPALA